jgi:hypothetical protein
MGAGAAGRKISGEFLNFSASLFTISIFLISRTMSGNCEKHLSVLFVPCSQRKSQGSQSKTMTHGFQAESRRSKKRSFVFAIGSDPDNFHHKGKPSTVLY